MTDPVRTLHQSLNRARTLVREGVFYTLTPEERDSLFIRAGELLKKLESVSQNSLVIGMLGGTGVGKSSLMNALAGSEIASTSHRRPHTDEVLIYRFNETPLPANFPVDTFPWKEITHDAASIRQILICDLPDFDSIAEEHRKQVLAFLEYLDLVVWVTSPEKYGDARFFDILQSVSKARRNFYFVLNKVDLLFDEKSTETAYEELHKISSSLRGYLTATAGIEDPNIYHISALDGVSQAAHTHWNQLSSFRNELFRCRELKEVKIIKAANVDKEIDELFAVFEKESLNISMFQKQLHRIAADFKQEMTGREHTLHEGITLWTESTPLRTKLISMATDTDVLVGPAGAFALLGQDKTLVGIDETDMKSPILPALNDIASLFQRQIDRIKNDTAGRLLREGIISPLVERTRSRFDQDMAAHIKDTIMQVGTAHFTNRDRPLYGVYRGIQYITYLLITLLLTFSLAGENAWKELYASPGIASAFNFIITAVFSAFSPRGLAALGSFALINIFVGYRFYREYRRIVEKRTEQLLLSFTNDLEVLWKEELERMYEKLAALGRELNENLDEIRRLRQ